MNSLINMEDKIKKNILDLNYNKYLQYKITSIIIGTTYLFALSISWITRQINLQDYIQMSVVAILSIVVLTPCIYFMINSGKNMNKIINLVKVLKI